MNIDNINEILDNIDMSTLSQKINSVEYQNYFLSPSGQEHYRLLSYISLNNDNVNFLDIGTYKGCSALAFSINPNNHVYSFDLIRHYDLNDENGISFMYGYVNVDKYKDLVLSCPYILLDTNHDGTFENTFYDFLNEINYKGILLLDDIKLNNEIFIFWNGINKEKHDISDIGHVTGTGLVIFE